MNPFDNTTPTRPYRWVDQPQNFSQYTFGIRPESALGRDEREYSHLEDQYTSGNYHSSSRRRMSAPFDSERHIEEYYSLSRSRANNMFSSRRPSESLYPPPPPYTPNHSYSNHSFYHPKISHPSAKELYGNENSSRIHHTTGTYTENRHAVPEYENINRRRSTSSLSAPQSPYRSHSPYRSRSPYKTTAHEDNDFPEMQHLSPSIQRKGTPTVFPAPDFDPVKDACDLRAAMKGFGTNEDTLINIICRRSNSQRQEIQHKYKTFYGRDLIEDVKSETSGGFQRVLIGLLLSPLSFYIKELSDAMIGLGTDEDVLVEILCTLSNAEIQAIKRGYKKVHGWTLEAELKSETSGSFKKFLVSLCEAGRDESGKIDPIEAFNDARDLLNAGELRIGTDGSTFNKILCERNFQQLKLIFQQYEHITGHSFEKAIKREFSGDIKDGLLAIYRCVLNKTAFFASRLHKSMAGIGTNNKQLIRIVISRSEIDLHDIKMEFEHLYGKSLRNWIKGDISGDYRHALYTLIGEQR